MRFKQKIVKLSLIDSNDDSFRITTQTNIDHLMASIDNVGVLNLPLLIEKKSGYKIVCGFRRIEACRRLGWTDVEARIIDSDTKKLECIKYAITDNSLHRPLNLIEQSRSINMLYDFFKDVSALGKLLSVMGLPDNPSIIKKMKELYHLPKFVQSGILSNTISLAMALELGRLQLEAGECLAKLFQTLTLSLNKQREILSLVKEISLREDISILKVIENDNLQKILTNKNLDRNQKNREIRIYLKQRRFPVITAAEKEFEKHVKKLKLGSGTKLIPPDNFEDTTYTLKLFFKNLIELKDRKASFDALIKNPSLNKILDRIT
ncbi:MAG: ParB/RepB/Spo0J family partition protein [Thermodesulfobacteriota bacterium]|nr:ParB/RepB/Spo0J family partition protein [Thermodesulfobacteriota bacterium]